MKMGRTILLVDDEENILRSLSRVFRRDNYNILQADSGEKGLSLLKENEVGVIISDQRMPQMTGIEFLGIVKEKYPETVRIVLSGYTELNSITDAINQGAIYKFLTKPWDDELLRANVDEAFRHFELGRENERLTNELQKANNALTNINTDLENRVEKKTKEVVLNLKVLQISQEILENLSIAVIGVDDDGVIVMANRLAHEILSTDTGYLVNMEAKDIIPEKILCLLERARVGIDENIECIELNNGCVAEVRCCLMGNSSQSKGSILMFAPNLRMSAEQKKVAS